MYLATSSRMILNPVMFVYEPNKRYISVDSDVLQNNVNRYSKLFICTKNNFEI